MAQAAKVKSIDLTGAVVVLDTNILDQTSLLKDPLSVSLLAYLVRLDASLGLPEVVRGEWRTHWAEHCRKKYDAFHSNRSWLNGHFDGVPEFELDVDEAARRGLEARLTDLQHILVEEKVQPNDWREAGEMVVKKLAPTTPGSQQYKDSLMWRALLRLGQGQLCVLVTSDKGFTAKGTTELEPSLAKEVEEHAAEVVVFSDLKEILEEMKAQVGPIEATIEDEWEGILEAVTEDVSSALGGEGWVLSGPPDTTHSVFATDDPGILAIAIDFECQIAPVDEPDSEHSIYVEAKSSALYDLRTEDLDIEIERLDVLVMTPHGDINTRIVDRGRPPRKFTLRLG